MNPVELHAAPTNLFAALPDLGARGVPLRNRRDEFFLGDLDQMLGGAGRAVVDKVRHLRASDHVGFTGG
jgi:hypothetical protein